MLRSLSRHLGVVRIAGARSLLSRVILCAVAAMAVGVDTRAQSVWYVDAAATPPGQGTAIAPYATIQRAIDAASTVSGDTLAVAAGTYHEAINYRGKALQIVGAGAAVTTIDATGRGAPVVEMISNEGPGTRLAHFTLRGAQTASYSGRAGGVQCNGARPTLEDLVITGNVASHGGGISIWDGNNAVIRRCLIYGNTASPDGGGVNIRRCPTVTIEDTMVRDNHATVWGGGFYFSDHVDAAMTRVTVVNNSSGSRGGAFILQSACEPTFEHVTIANNTAPSGAGFFLYHANVGPNRAVLHNSVVWNNTPSEVHVWDGASGSVAATYTDFRGGMAGIGNINADPMFSNPAVRDYSLLNGSPCINAGNPSSPPDLDGSRADMGALPHFVQFQTYCTPGTSSNGCRARLSYIGTPSASAGSGFILIATQVPGQRMGYLYYGVTGAQATPWGPASILCVAPPRQRMAANAPTGGTAGFCDGVVAQDWNAYIASHPSAIGQPFAAGQHVWAQAYYRDPPSPKTTNLSDGLHFVLSP